MLMWNMSSLAQLWSNMENQARETSAVLGGLPWDLVPDPLSFYRRMRSQRGPSSVRVWQEGAIVTNL